MSPTAIAREVSASAVDATPRTDENTALAPAPGAGDSSASDSSASGVRASIASDSSATPERASSSSATSARTIGGRVLYWLPVLGPLALFGQISLLGLRPALCERERLAEAEVALEARYRADLTEHDAIAANLRARRDPIFLERQRRWLEVAAPAR